MAISAGFGMSNLTWCLFGRWQVKRQIAALNRERTQLEKAGVPRPAALLTEISKLVANLEASRVESPRARAIDAAIEARLDALEAAVLADPTFDRRDVLLRVVQLQGARARATVASVSRDYPELSQ